MASQLLGANGKPVVVIGGTTAYLKVFPSIAATAGGAAVTLPVTFSDASYSASVFYNDEVHGASVMAGTGNDVIIKIDHDKTNFKNKNTINATVELLATLTTSIPNTSYNPKDILAFRWNVFIEQPTKS